MAFKNNYSEAQIGSSLKPAGDYECILTALEEKVTKNGAAGLNLTFIIRNDINGQKYGNACLFHTIWKAKEPTDNDKSVKGYLYNQIMALGKAAELPDGKEYKDLEEYCNNLVNKCIRVTIEHREYKGDIQERVNFLNQTKFPSCNHKFKQASTTKKSDTFANPNSAELDNLDGFEMIDDGVPF